MPSALRLSLILPIHSRRAILAAVRVVFHLLRQARVELDLLRSASDVLARRPGSPGGVLFVSAEIGGVVDVGAFEQDLRERILRSYAREGISPVEYHLELV